MAHQIGETLLMNWNGWLTAFRVIGVRQVEDQIEYRLSMLETDNGPQWTKPG